MDRLLRSLLIAAGTLCVALGVIGIVVPGLPTTPFLLLAGVCYARSSPRLLHWLHHNRWFGSYIRNYREGRGIPLREKVITLVALWIMIGLTVLLVIPLLWVKLLLIMIAAAVTVHVARIKTLDSAMGK